MPYFIACDLQVLLGRSQMPKTALHLGVALFPLSPRLFCGTFQSDSEFGFVAIVNQPTTTVEAEVLGDKLGNFLEGY